MRQWKCSYASKTSELLVTRTFHRSIILCNQSALRHSAQFIPTLRLMEVTILYKVIGGCIGIMENKMETTRLYRDSIGILLGLYGDDGK